ncbi:MAG TPA: 30S ribosomal protein S20, partial [Acidimicrobiia bacterium]|nr:30S ribosomal protein S20 [Acidimicrobiia bacterium]
PALEALGRNSRSAASLSGRSNAFVTLSISRWSTARAMANIKSQIKRNRSNEKRRLRNQRVRSELKTRTKSAVTAIEAGADDAPEAVRMAQKRINKAASKGRIHKNAAARRTSRLMKKAVSTAE